MKALPFRLFHSRAPGSAVQYIVAGLGNPGAQYDRTRHNAGFWVLDQLAAGWNAPIKRLKFQSLYGDALFEGQRVILLKPQTFMNHSGRALRQCADFYKVPWQRVIVVYDDVSLPPGKLRVRAKGSDGGHNGIKSILYHAQTDGFPRVKIGVGGPPHPDMDLADWVLSGISAAQKEALAIDRAQEAVAEILRNGVGSAMNLFNAG